jgi:hypothetical protein
MSYLNFFLIVVLWAFSVLPVSSQVLTVDGHNFKLDEKLFDMWGVRVASASQKEEYTSSLISNLDDYKSSGINCISVFVQGSSGGFSDPFRDEGKSVDDGHLNRIIRIIDECATRDMVVIVGVFYQRTLKDPTIRKLNSEVAIRNAIRTVTLKLKPYRNVIINIANEQNSKMYQSFVEFEINNAANIISLCEEVKKIDSERIVGGGGYSDSLNVVIGKSQYVDALLFDTFSKDIENGHHSGWHYDYFRQEGVPDKPIVNVEIFGGWTQKFVPQGVYTEEGKLIHFVEIAEAKKRPGLYVHLHSNPWFQGVAQKFENHFDLGGKGTMKDPGVMWYFNKITE